MKYKKTLFWEIKENTIAESKKYSSRTEFYKKAHGAYTVAKKNGWLSEMPWLAKQNVYKDPIDVVYKYHFPDLDAVYVGRTIHPEIRDQEHRTTENDTVRRFSIERNLEIPPMEIIESNLTVLEGARREQYWAAYYKAQGLQLINKQPCGSLGYMTQGKWSKRRCFAEASKYCTRSEFQRKSSHAYRTAKAKGWIDEMTWFPKPHNKPNGYWNDKGRIIEESKKYTTLKDFQKYSGGAFHAARRLGIIDELTWLSKAQRLPCGYWKDKDHCIEESKKYHSKKEFQTKNQSAYWASLKYGYMPEMPWLTKPIKNDK